MTKQYTPQEIEKKWYKYWLDNNLFSANKNQDKPPYTVVMPPPNITGVLHMGHVLNNTIQDVLVRRARMQRKEACWVPGMDHASIATEAKVAEMLRQKGISKKDLSRQQFLDYVWDWKDRYATIILDQLKQLGVSCDWSRAKFTMEPSMYESVQKIFIQLYDDGLIYRGLRIVSWDPEGLTALSDEEIIHKPTKTDLVFIKYRLVKNPNPPYPDPSQDDYITVATTRPETIFGDMAICINPNDQRYQHLRGTYAIVPIVNRTIPIIFDTYVDPQFGTGCLKVTPAHDHNDYHLALKHNLSPPINILNEDGSLNQNTLHYTGQDRFLARKNVIAELNTIALIPKIDVINTTIGHSERTNAIVEPRISTQWFVKMETLARPALENVINGKIKFHPKRLQNIYKTWLENIKDWCISRQLWWGHRIPVYYLPDGTHVAALSPQEALEKAKKITNNPTLQLADLTQDQDVLDTWFSSWIWPIEVFNGISNPHNPDFKYFYPTNDIVTAPEIIFFWIARMIIAAYKFTDKAPFENVYFTGIVRDKQHRKMSKSLGNSPDPIDLIQKYGADGVRLGMLLCSQAGNDLIFDEKLCEQGRNFANKLWNASTLIQTLKPVQHLNCNHETAIAWIEARFQALLSQVEDSFADYNISQALMHIYRFVWEDFCSTYLEMIKPKDQLLDTKTHNHTIKIFEEILKILHPFIPFITEEISHILCFYTQKDSISHSQWPTISQYDKDILQAADMALEFIASVRNVKIENKLPLKTPITIFYTTHKDLPNWLNRFSAYIKKMAHINDFIFAPSIPPKTIPIQIDNRLFYPEVTIDINFEKEIIKLEKDIKYLVNILNLTIVKLANESFLKKASPSIIQIEKNKQLDFQKRLHILQQKLEEIKYRANQ